MLKELIVVISMCVVLIVVLFGFIIVLDKSLDPKREACQKIELEYSTRLDMCIDGKRPWNER